MATYELCGMENFGARKLPIAQPTFPSNAIKHHQIIVVSVTPLMGSIDPGFNSTNIPVNPINTPSTPNLLGRSPETLRKIKIHIGNMEMRMATTPVGA